MALRVIQQVDYRQLGQLLKNLRQRCRAEALQVHGAGDQARFDTGQLAAIEFDFENLVLIANFRE
ncbi:hypothetical protein D3C85_1762770 [compost metagenome]